MLPKGKFGTASITLKPLCISPEGIISEADGEEVLLVEGERKTSEQFLSKLDAAAISVVNELLKLSPVEVFSKL